VTIIAYPVFVPAVGRNLCHICRDRPISRANTADGTPLCAECCAELYPLETAVPADPDVLYPIPAICAFCKQDTGDTRVISLPVAAPFPEWWCAECRRKWDEEMARQEGGVPYQTTLAAAYAAQQTLQRHAAARGARVVLVEGTPLLSHAGCLPSCEFIEQLEGRVSRWMSAHPGKIPDIVALLDPVPPATEPWMEYDTFRQKMREHGMKWSAYRKALKAATTR
jgi:hypothetical protein